MVLDFSIRSKEAPVNYESPPGYFQNMRQFHPEVTRGRDMSILVKKSWDIALAPLKSMPMNLFIMYMAGNSISLFPIMMVGMLFLRPVKALISINSTFRLIDGDQAIWQKLVYLFGNLLGLGVALHKCQSMGLLPTHSSDWLDFLAVEERVEFV